MTPTTIKDQVYYWVSRIPQGKVATYGQIALLAGAASPRQVGHYLHENPDASKVPCHRVVNVQGRLAPAYAFGGNSVQKSRLSAEKVVFKGEKVDLAHSLWQTSLKKLADPNV